MCVVSCTVYVLSWPVLAYSGPIHCKKAVMRDRFRRKRLSSHISCLELLQHLHGQRILSGLL